MNHLKQYTITVQNNSLYKLENESIKKNSLTKLFLSSIVVFFIASIAHGESSILQQLNALKLENQELRLLKQELEKKIVAQKTLLKENTVKINTIKNKIAIIQGNPTVTLTASTEANKASENSKNAQNLASER